MTSTKLIDAVTDALKGSELVHTAYFDRPLVKTCSSQVCIYGYRTRARKFGICFHALIAEDDASRCILTTPQLSPHNGCLTSSSSTNLSGYIGDDSAPLWAHGEGREISQKVSDVRIEQQDS